MNLFIFYTIECASLIIDEDRAPQEIIQFEIMLWVILKFVYKMWGIPVCGREFIFTLTKNLVDANRARFRGRFIFEMRLSQSISRLSQFNVRRISPTHLSMECKKSLIYSLDKSEFKKKLIFRALLTAWKEGRTDGVCFS